MYEYEWGDKKNNTNIPTVKKLFLQI